MTSYYNENDPRSAAWLRELIQAGAISTGEVDERSIEDVRPSDLNGYTQHHFFAGIGGWACALRLAGWPDDRPVWTGSCPCQPFSQAGKRAGFADQRHLWPAWHWLIQQCRPATILGEQVGRVGGAQWLDLVFDDLEAMDYACGAIDLPACSVGAPHIRQRIYWVADAEGDQRRRMWQRNPEQPIAPGGCGAIGGMGDTGASRLPARKHPELFQPRGRQEGGATEQPGYPFWANIEFIGCKDGKHRPTQPGIFPLAHGVPGRVGLLRGYGNAIVPQLAAEFIKAIGDWK
ncbi:MAG: DNA cytosine methyltransferase [Magnetococcales bacterium]|nr:DNA cytosine methyltransferase [Magnetococcales bacterium]